MAARDKQSIAVTMDGYSHHLPICFASVGIDVSGPALGGENFEIGLCAHDLACCVLYACLSSTVGNSVAVSLVVCVSLHLEIGLFHIRIKGRHTKTNSLTL
jgi:hypothetical protein